MDVFRQVRYLYSLFIFDFSQPFQRLEDEYDAKVIITAPTVPYKGNPLSPF